MNRLTVIFLAVALCSCTTLHPILEPAARIQQQLGSGAPLEPGDSVVITTNDGVSHLFSVTAVGAGHVEGRSVSIPIDQIAPLEKREVSVGKTLLVVVGIAAALTLSAGYSQTHHRNCSGAVIC